MFRTLCRRFSAKYKTMQEVTDEVAQRFGISRAYVPTDKSGREHLSKLEPKSADDLPARTMRDSFSEAIIPLGTDVTAREKHMTSIQTVRYGRLLEAMDSFAVWVIVNHLKLNNLRPTDPLPYTIVTMRVDSISFARDVPKIDRDIRLSGHVSWVGKSSAEVLVAMEQQRDNAVWGQLTSALFVMAGRNAANTKAMAINAIKPCGDKEMEIFKAGQDKRKLRSPSSTFKEPTADEQKHIHAIFMQTIDHGNMTLNERILPAGSKWMSACTLSNLVYSHPENRNTQNTVFGGYLMLQSLELSWTLAYMHTKQRPKLEYISNITFERPVRVSSQIRMSANIVCTDATLIQIFVVARVQDYEQTDEQGYVSNEFHYTYSVREDTIPRVLPQSYHEAMWYLEGRRHLQLVSESKAKSDSGSYTMLSRAECGC